jgi:hypothetical protein
LPCGPAAQVGPDPACSVRELAYRATAAPEPLGPLSPGLPGVRGVYEASAVVVDELRVRAVAVRLERNKLVWRITALEIG